MILHEIKALQQDKQAFSQDTSYYSLTFLLSSVYIFYQIANLISTMSVQQIFGTIPRENPPAAIRDILPGLHGKLKNNNRTGGKIIEIIADKKVAKICQSWIVPTKHGFFMEFIQPSNKFKEVVEIRFIQSRITHNHFF